MYVRRYTPEQIDFLKENIRGKSHTELTTLFNNHFSEHRTVQQITAACKNRKLCNGIDGRYVKGNIPYNKGTKGVIYGGKETQFKEGTLPWNYRPVGSERVNSCGYTEVKVADPKTWRAKHVIVWEQHNGRIPQGYAVVFGDGDKSNIALDNLVLVTRGELAIMNKRGLIGGSSDLTKAGQMVARVIKTAGERKGETDRC